MSPLSSTGIQSARNGLTNFVSCTTGLPGSLTRPALKSFHKIKLLLVYGAGP